MKKNIHEKDQFFSKISHDLRGSFTSILGFSDILNDPTETLLKEEVTEFSTRIGTQSKETFALLVNFINWLKLENYNSGLTFEKIELLDLFYEIQSLHQQKIAKMKIDVNYNLLNSEIIFLDYEILKSIFNNIIMFLLKTCSNNSCININSTNSSEKYVTIEILASCNAESTPFLRNVDLKNLNDDLASPIIFTIKFVELCGGLFEFSVNLENNLFIKVQLPKE